MTYEEIDCDIEATTDAAVLVRYENETEWIPRSLIADGDAVDESTDRVEVADWKLKELGWL